MICRFHHGVFIVIDHASHHVWSISMMNQKKRENYYYEGANGGQGEEVAVVLITFLFLALYRAYGGEEMICGTKLVLSLR